MVYTELSGVSALHSVTESDEVARLLQLDSQDTASRGMSTLPAIMEDTLATPRFARYHQAMESADRLITEPCRQTRTLNCSCCKFSSSSTSH